MIITLYYPKIRFNYKVDVGKDEYLEYLWQKEIGKPFSIFTYFLEQNGKEVYNKLEYLWFKNQLDLFDIRQEESFKQFLLDRFEMKAYSKYQKEEEEMIMEEDRLKADLPTLLRSFTTDKDENYQELTLEELEEIFLDNFMGEK